MYLLPILGIALLLLLSAFFSSSEIAFTTVNSLRLKKAAEAGDKAAQRAKMILDGFDSMLTTILVGNNLVNIAASSLTTLVALSIAGEGAVTVGGVIITLLLLVFGEITPKILAKQHAEAIVRAVSLPLSLLMLVLKPFVFLIVRLVDFVSRAWSGKEAEPTITEEEFSAILDTVEDEGVIDEETTDLMQSALEFGDLTCEEAMTPRVDMVAIDIDDAPEEIFRTVMEAGFSRIPVYKDSIDRIVGVLPANSYMLRRTEKEDPEIEPLLCQPLFVHKTLKLDELLKKMQRRHMPVALVVDEYGGTLGLITMEDVLEQLVGEIWDEKDDVVLDMREVQPNEYECSGQMTLRDFFDEIDFNDRNFDSEYTTLGGWAIEMLDSEPAEGESFRYENLRVTVLKMDGMRVEKLRVVVAPEADEGGEDDFSRGFSALRS